MRALPLALLFFLFGCHASPPAPSPPFSAPPSSPPIAEPIHECGLEPAIRRIGDCASFDPDHLATFADVQAAMELAAPPDVAPSTGRYYRSPGRFHRVAGLLDEEAITVARSYLCRTDLRPDTRFPAGARAYVAWQAARVHLVAGDLESATIWLHEAAAGPPDLPETAKAAVLQLELLDDIVRKTNRASCYDVMATWVRDAYARICEVERPYATKACKVLGSVSADIDRLQAFHH